MKLDSALSSVVLPEPVPPLTMMLSRACTAARKKSTTGGVIAPTRIRSSTPKRFVPKRRIVSVGPSMASGAMIALTREPSGRRASTIGLDSSRRRPSGAMMRSITSRTWRSSTNCFDVSSIRPRRSTNTLRVAVDHDLGDVGIVQQALERAQTHRLFDHFVADARGVLRRRDVLARREQLVGDRVHLLAQLGELPRVGVRARGGEKVDLGQHRRVQLGLEPLGRGGVAGRAACAKMETPPLLGRRASTRRGTTARPAARAPAGALTRRSPIGFAVGRPQRRHRVLLGRRRERFGEAAERARPVAVAMAAGARPRS